MVTDNLTTSSTLSLVDEFLNERISKLGLPLQRVRRNELVMANR
jgi:hypothetical protein